MGYPSQKLPLWAEASFLIFRMGDSPGMIGGSPAKRFMFMRLLLSCIVERRNKDRERTISPKFFCPIFCTHLGSWTSARLGHGCARPNACFSKVSRACLKLLTRDVRANDPRDVCRISGPIKANGLCLRAPLVENGVERPLYGPHLNPYHSVCPVLGHFSVRGRPRHSEQVRARSLQPAVLKCRMGVRRSTPGTTPGRSNSPEIDIRPTSFNMTGFRCTGL